MPQDDDAAEPVDRPLPVRDLLDDDEAGPGDERERLELLSPAFDDGDVLPERFARDGGDVSPPLEWTAVPAGTVEVAVLCQDPDAPGGIFTHWVLAGIDPTTTVIAEGMAPPGAVEGVNGFGELGWAGPQPPPGDGPHRYVFTLVASSTWLELARGASADDLLEQLDGNELARGELVGVYER